MNNVSFYIDEIDANRIRRAKELSELKVRMTETAYLSRYGVNSKATIVLSYAHWEGFYNECINIYVNLLKGIDKKISDISWPMLVGILRPELQRLRDRNHSPKAEYDFVNNLKNLIDENFDNFDSEVISSRSNLNYEKLRSNFDFLGFNVAPFNTLRLRIDKELVGWRHGVAHGDDPDLSAVDIDNHIEFTQNMLLLLSDVFPLCQDSCRLPPVSG
ncbi:MAE_28990/MAE_18760 family HEPN-like nuclease [Thiohalophilus sp.]|uniref:MAE_28990/MAE_18760 family HEPN-like nuclease n=1 Tax=Thiohalophilus sp. TaxID=3028392 RepID=UPI002ACDD7EF|nr:MAE_28990/MAE_18760 family HEPN-like nuclease [Thiohalophilus sp.]MDZ7662474.1 MAE_28990/MAE_18760 family HEPN-like nuclease [Thiohalophilus sp.]